MSGRPSPTCATPASRSTPGRSPSWLPLDRALAEVIDRCLRRDPLERFASGEALRQALEPLVPERQFAAIPEGNPYRGLHTFEAEHRGLFFGRDVEIRGVLESLRSQPFVLLAGDSGVGKSSTVPGGGAARRPGRRTACRPNVEGHLVRPRAPPHGSAGHRARRRPGPRREGGAPASVGRPQGSWTGRFERRSAIPSVCCCSSTRWRNCSPSATPRSRTSSTQLVGWLAEPAPGAASCWRPCAATSSPGWPPSRALAIRSSRALTILRPMDRPRIRCTSGGASHRGGLRDGRPGGDAGRHHGGRRRRLPLLQFALAEALGPATPVARS